MAFAQGLTTRGGTGLENRLEGFLTDRKAQNLAAETIVFYQVKLGAFLTFCEEQAISRI